MADSSSGDYTIGLESTMAVTWVTGSITSGYLSTAFYPQHILCGSIDIYPTYFSGGYMMASNYCNCSKCSKIISHGKMISVVGVSGLYATYCWDCANYRYQGGGFPSQNQIIKEYITNDLPLVSGTPNGIIADYLEDQGRLKDANFLRNLASD